LQEKIWPQTKRGRLPQEMHDLLKTFSRMPIIGARSNVEDSNVPKWTSQYHTFIHIRYRFHWVRNRFMSYGNQRRASYGDNRNFGSKPVEVGKEYDVQVTETSYKGDGVARVQGFVIFVKNGRAGENVKVRVNSVGSRFAIAEIVN
jgi:predicted RNA-binding protein with TRAM domain